MWAEALPTAVYLRNRSPTSAVQGETPWTNVKPNVDHLQVFGCLCFEHIAKDEREKFDSKAKRCVLLGYSTLRPRHIYRLYDLERGGSFSVVTWCLMRKMALRRSLKAKIPVRHHLLILISQKATTQQVCLKTRYKNLQKKKHPHGEKILKTPEYYGYRASMTDTSDDPKGFKDAVTSREWVDAMDKEMESLHSGI